MVRRIRAAVASTASGARVLGGLGGFAGLVELPKLKNPVLAAATDGVGTKVLVAEALGRFSGVGIDLVAMSVNDLITTGARPLLFLDYLAAGRLEPEKAAALVEGVAEGCRRSGCVLLGGETAEMPGLYQNGQFDLAGFAVGVVEKEKIIDPAQVQAGDAIIGLASSGIHSNGFSLVRKILEVNKISYVDELPGLGPVGELLLEPTVIYTGRAAALAAACKVRAMAHITGGGLPGNLARVIPDGLTAHINLSSWQVPPLFTELARLGNVAAEEMRRTFNMGIGYVAIVPPGCEKKALAAAPGSLTIGRIEAGAARVEFINGE